MSEMDIQNEAVDFRCGFVAIVGRPNVGKSTLLNQLIGQKISITSRKAQTTRHRITGVHSSDTAQFVFVDTPGFQTKYQNALNQAMNRSVTSTLADVDVILYVIEAGYFSAADEEVLKLLPDNRPVLLVLNKIDELKDKNEMFPFIEAMNERFKFHAIVPISAQKNLSIDVLLKVVEPLLPKSVPLYDVDQVTDRNERFLAAEIIREKIFRLMGEELPYSMTVEIEKFEDDETRDGRELRRIHAAVLVDRDGQKAMLIGQNGEKLKRIATEARQDMEKLFDAKVFLEVWVKVKSGWADDTRLVRQYGYE
ncbi:MULTISPECIES: GTPase Era [Iodobacter]|uniref:GTPase Era n=3 Tax=Iodobacter TaxID=32014 RepID=A0A377Q875_9NEIS|nr:GTPase Era [Iodobacter violacea]PHV00387.1 GTPase Era [Iodobacter sp. BJB302]TCU89570.1 GTP-binding protein Era [Iodobacter fluviatilis]STQ90940.1 GTP-binding protein Era [Iodobacter fluviatilis]